MNKFIIIVPFYNVSKWIKFNIRSVKKQNYNNFKCVLVDDLSTDNTVEIVKKEIENDNRFVLIENNDKKFALKNIYDAILFAEPSKEDVIITLDGDDWFYSNDVLSYLNDFYQKEDCWITYGSYAEFPSGQRGKFAKQIPEHIIRNSTFRENEWCASHLRTFKYHLWSEIKKEDFLDTNGDFYRMAWDLAFMFPMLEMAGENSRHIEKILYAYNLSNPLNDHKVDNSYQLSLEREIRHKEKYLVRSK
jgi:glycosyltransferase involved in cell wall biosynthesis